MGYLLAARRDDQATEQERRGKVDMDRAGRRYCTELCDLLGTMMTENGPVALDVVALLTDMPDQRLARGQVGTVVQQLDNANSLVEFSDDQGNAYALAPCPHRDLLTLHYVPEEA